LGPNLETTAEPRQLTATPLWTRAVQQEGAIPDHNYFGVVNISVPWDRYTNPLCSSLDRPSVCWTVRVGDLVAVRKTVHAEVGDADTRQGSHFPFTEPWLAAQILAIYKPPKTDEDDRDVSSPGGAYSVQLRFFRRESSAGSSKAIETLWETAEVTPAKARNDKRMPSTCDLLGPIAIYPSEKVASKKDNLIVHQHPFLPLASFVYGGEIGGDDERNPRRLNILEVAQRGISLYSHYDSDQKRKKLVELWNKNYHEHAKKQQQATTSLFEQFMGDDATAEFGKTESCYGDVHGDEEESNPDNDDETVRDLRIEVPGVPIHFDKSSRRSYFNKIRVKPAYENMAIRKTVGHENDIWEVKLGDLVAVHYNDYSKSRGPAYFEPCASECHEVKREEAQSYPFAGRIPWGSKFSDMPL
jgi:hypothetical protein